MAGRSCCRPWPNACIAAAVRTSTVIARGGTSRRWWACADEALRRATLESRNHLFQRLGASADPFRDRGDVVEVDHGDPDIRKMLVAGNCHDAIVLRMQRRLADLGTKDFQLRVTLGF